MKLLQDKIPECLCLSDSFVDSAEWLVGLVDAPDEPGLESSACVVVGEGSCGGVICGPASPSASTFSRAAPLFNCASATSLDLVAAGVIGGECIEDTLGL